MVPHRCWHWPAAARSSRIGHPASATDARVCRGQRVPPDRDRPHGTHRRTHPAAAANTRIVGHACCRDGAVAQKESAFRLGRCYRVVERDVKFGIEFLLRWVCFGLLIRFAELPRVARGIWRSSGALGGFGCVRDDQCGRDSPLRVERTRTRERVVQFQSGSAASLAYT